MAGISVKLSPHPSLFACSQRSRTMNDCTLLKILLLLAKQYNINEYRRRNRSPQLSLDLMEALVVADLKKGFEGIGFRRFELTRNAVLS